jgi:hypothetical protein
LIPVFALRVADKKGFRLTKAQVHANEAPLFFLLQESIRTKHSSLSSKQAFKTQISASSTMTGKQSKKAKKQTEEHRASRSTSQKRNQR